MDSVTVTLENATSIIPVTAKVFTVGRAATHQLSIKVVVEVTQHPSISKDHAYIEVRPGGRVVLRDLESLNGSKVNDVRINKGGEVELKDGDVVQFGKTDAIYTVRIRQKEISVAPSSVGKSKQDKRINLKEMFAPIGQAEQPEVDPPVVEKKIKVSELKESVTKPAPNELRSSRPAESQRGSLRIPSNRPAEKRIQLGNLDDFLKEVEVPAEQQVRLVDEVAKERQLRQSKDKEIERVKLQNRRIEIQKANIEAERLQAERQLLRQQEQLKNQLEQERQRLEQERELFMKKMEEDYQVKLRTQLESRKQTVQQREKQERDARDRKVELQGKKKEIEMEADALAKEYEAMYRESVQKTKKTVEKHEELERQLGTSIASRECQVAELRQRIEQQQKNNDSIKQGFLMINSKNKALLLYASELQRIMEEAKNTFSIARPDGHLLQQKKDVQGHRKLLRLKNKEIYSLKASMEEAWNKYLSANSRAANQVKLIKENVQKTAQMRGELFEYIQREKEVQSRWESDLRQNTELGQRVKSVQLQIAKNSDNLEQMLQENTKKLCQYHLQFLRLMKNSRIEKKQAAEFLIDQLVTIEKEKQQIVMDNERLHLKIQSSIAEIQSLRDESKYLSELMFSQVDPKQQYSHLEALRSRIIELTEEVDKLQPSATVSSLLRLAKQFEQVEQAINDENEKHFNINQRTNKAVEAGSAQGMQSVLDFFGGKLFERDAQLQNLHDHQHALKRQLELSQAQLRDQEEKFEQASISYERYKETQVKLARQILNESKPH